MSTYLFYDLETSGLNKAFDQVLQFAAIRTDPEFNILERHEFTVQLNVDTVPAIAALLTNQLLPTQLAAGIPEFHAIKTIHQLLNTPGTCSLGYNTLTFDDEFLRFSFYRNLLPAYTHQYLNNCCRLDLYPMVLFYCLYEPNALTWPVTADGKTSLKLEALNHANNFAAGRAHDAMVDVEITLALAKQLRRSDRIWQYVSGFFNKATDQQRLAKLPVAITANNHAHQLGLYIAGYLGTKANYQTLALSLGISQHYANQTLWMPLDNPKLMAMTATTIAECSTVIRKKAGEPGFFLPPTAQYCRIDAERQAIIDANLAWLAANPQHLQAIQDYYQQYRYPVIPTLDPQAALYQHGFISKADEHVSALFHHANDLSASASLIERFKSPTVRALAIRIIGRLDPTLLSPTQYTEFTAYLARINSDDVADKPIDYRLEPHRCWQAELVMLEQQQHQLADQSLIEAWRLVNTTV